MNRETDQFGWQTEFDIGIADKIKRVAHFLGRLIAFRPENAPEHMSNHYRGANAMLDAHLDKQRAVVHYTLMAEQAKQDQLPFDPPIVGIEE